MKREDAEEFKIYIDRLKEGKRESLDKTFSPTFLEVHEADLFFNTPVTVKGVAYLAENTLVLHFVCVATEVTMPCAICNQEVQIPLMLSEFYHTVDVSTIKGRIFFFNDLLREAILIELPHVAECSGNCPARKEIEKYLI